jgi:hypothetical protein
LLDLVDWWSTNCSWSQWKPLSSRMIKQTKILAALPAIIAQPMDSTFLSQHQAYLRLQVELFQANEEDASTPVQKVRILTIEIQRARATSTLQT